jgi:hypothetical protein
MAVTKLRVCFNTVFVIPDPDLWGPGQWYFTATVDGAAVGDPSQEFDAMERQSIELPDDSWSTTVDVSAKRAGDKIEIRFSAREDDSFSSGDLGQVSATLKYPFKQELDLTLTGGPGKSRYELNLVVEIAEEKATIGPAGPRDVYVNRQAGGTATFTTLAGAKPPIPRVEICPVVPLPARGSMPKRPKFRVGLAHGKKTPQAAPVPLTATLNLNALPNPAVIPILSSSDPCMAQKAARVAVTYIEPGNLDTGYFTWHVKSGPAAFWGGTDGQTEVLVYGTGTGAADAEAIIELRWNGATGTLLSTFRAWVGKIKQIPYRALIVDPSKAAMQVRSRPADVLNHVAMANILLWHAGLNLVPDVDATAWDSATSSGNGIFVITLSAKHNGWTIGVNDDLTPVATRLNFNPGVMHFCYIKSTKDAGTAGSATDRPQLSGANETLSGTPSPSWVYPSGVPPDSAAKTVVMKSMPKSTARPKAKGDNTYLTARGLPADAMNKLFGLLMPDYTRPSDPDWGQTMAHETGHVLGLAHRGNGGQSGAAGGPSDDGIDDRAGNGYPWLENVMCYGYARSQDLDIIQAKVIRRHPVLR